MPPPCREVIMQEMPSVNVDQPTRVMPNKKFHVRVGIAQCTVSCQSEKEAVGLARKQLNDEMPQMREVINGIRDKEFRVDSAE